MKIVNNIKELRMIIKNHKKAGKIIGFVPTMGYLHEGHLSLLREAREKSDIVVLSIFVNPIQFGVGEDLDKYPRDEKRDTELAASVGTDIVFIPSVAEMYGSENIRTNSAEELFKTRIITSEQFTKKLCGISRPTHFDGVTTVVGKLFNIVSPDKAFFGQKDAQQLFIIKKMVSDLNFDIEIESCPIVRESDGLAKSSRNVYLSEKQRNNATVLFKSLNYARAEYDVGVTDAEKIRKAMSEMIEEAGGDIDYISFVDMSNLEDLAELNRDSMLLALAVKFGSTRLIDNIILKG